MRAGEIAQQSPGCSSTGPKFDSQSLRGGSLSVSPTPLMVPPATDMHVVHSCTFRQNTHTHESKLNFKKIKVPHIVRSSVLYDISTTEINHTTGIKRCGKEQEMTILG